MNPLRRPVFRAAAPAAALFFAFFVVSAPSLRADSAPTPGNGPSVLTISGKGEVSIPSTHVRLDLAVEHRAPTSAEAQAEVSRRANAVTALLREAEVSELKTTGLQLFPIYERQQPRPGGAGDAGDAQRIAAYQASTSVSFLVPVEKAGELADQAIRAGANRINRFQLTATPQAIRRAEDEAVRRAARDALDRADLLLGAVAMKRDAVLRLNLSEAPVFPMHRGMEMRAMAAADAIQIEGGEETVTAVVTAEVSFRPAKD